MTRFKKRCIFAIYLKTIKKIIMEFNIYQSGEGKNIRYSTDTAKDALDALFEFFDSSYPLVFEIDIQDNDNRMQNFGLVTFSDVEHFLEQLVKLSDDEQMYRLLCSWDNGSLDVFHTDFFLASSSEEDICHDLYIDCLDTTLPAPILWCLDYRELFKELRHSYNVLESDGIFYVGSY